MPYRPISGRSWAVLNRKAQPGGAALTAADIIELVRACHASGIAPDGTTAGYATIGAALATAAHGPQNGDGDPRRAAVLEPMDSRVHFAFNCASRSCPYVWIYEPDRLDEQPDAATRAFVAGDVQVDGVAREVALSKIFAWFALDFEDASGVLAAAIQYMPPNDGVRLWLEQHRESVTVKFRPTGAGTRCPDRHCPHPLSAAMGIRRTVSSARVESRYRHPTHEEAPPGTHPW